jgi:ankyrin repeat protein
MRYASLLYRLPPWFLFLGLSLLSQCDCKNPDQKQTNTKKNQLPTEEKPNEKRGLGGAGNSDKTIPPGPPNPSSLSSPPPPPSPAGLVFQNVSARDLQAMERVNYTGGGSPTFLVKMLRELKQDPSKVDIRGRDVCGNGATILHAAVDYAAIKAEEIIKGLVVLGVDINAKDYKGQTPLHHVIQKSFLEKDTHAPSLLRTLLELGADVDMPDMRGNMPLHLAAESPDRIKHLQFLLSKVTPAVLNQLNVNGHSPLHVAVLHRNIEAVRALIDKGANMDLRSKDGKTALQLAAARGDWDILKVLEAKKGGIPDAERQELIKIARNPKIITYLSGMAPHVPKVEDNRIEDLKIHYPLLVNKLSNPSHNINETDSTDSTDSTALHYATCLPETSYVELLLAHGADVNLKDKNGRTPLHWAAKKGHLEVVKILVANGANIDPVDNQGYTPLLLAGLADQMEVVKFLVDHGVDLNAQAHDGDTLLEYAARYKKLELFQYLLSKKVSVNLRGKDTRSPLYSAVTSESEEMVKKLLEAGADPNQPGMTVPTKSTLRAAINNKNIKIVKALLDADARVTPEDVTEVTPEDVTEAPTEEMKELLQSKLPK